MTNLISKHGGYQNLKSFQMAQIIFDLTAEFCLKFVDKKSRTIDQMLQAARSGKQNIAEGSQTSGVSKTTELKLVNVARASLQELLEDYQDFLRQHALPQWSKNDKRALAMRQLAYKSNRSYKTYLSYLSHPESAANCLVCLINQADYLLDRQLGSLQKNLNESGDFAQRLKDNKKQALSAHNQGLDELFKAHGFKRLENGRVIGLNDSDQ